MCAFVKDKCRFSLQLSVPHSSKVRGRYVYMMLKSAATLTTPPFRPNWPPFWQLLDAAKCQLWDNQAGLQWVELLYEIRYPNKAWAIECRTLGHLKLLFRQCQLAHAADLGKYQVSSQLGKVAMNGHLLCVPFCRKARELGRAGQGRAG